MAPEDLFDTVQLVFDLSQGIEKKLETFCLKEDKITRMKTLLADYNSQSPDKRLLQIESKTATQSLAALFSQTDALPRDSLNVMLKPFAIEYAEFYEQYLQARKIQTK